MTKIIKIAVLGCTGSIGTQTLQLARSLENVEVTALSVNSNIQTLKSLCDDFSPVCVGIADENAHTGDLSCQVYKGKNCNAQIAARDDIDCVVIALSGMEAIFPLLAAIKTNKKIAIANKESIVCAGDLINDALNKSKAKLLPVDSEQSAIFQCLQGVNKNEVQSLVLTASGGIFLGYNAQQLEKVTLDQALMHPTWSMGKKITIDCSTLANKGLEVIEAHYLFNVAPENIHVKVHPQSIVHSMLQTVDGSYLAQIGAPDMRLAIQYALTYPNRVPCIANKLDILKLCKLEFFEPDKKTFPALQYAYDALNLGGTAPAIYNASNEMAVELFMQGKIKYSQIANCIAQALEHVTRQKVDCLESVLQSDKAAREYVVNYCNTI